MGIGSNAELLQIIILTILKLPVFLFRLNAVPSFVCPDFKKINKHSLFPTYTNWSHGAPTTTPKPTGRCWSFLDWSSSLDPENTAGGKTMCKVCLCCISSYWSTAGGFGNHGTSEGVFSLLALRLLLFVPKTTLIHTSQGITFKYSGKKCDQCSVQCASP